MLVQAQDVGGHQLSRTMALDVGDGTVSLKMGATISTL